MKNHESLLEIIKKATEHIQKDPKHHLTLGYRQKIWSEFGPKLNAKNPDSIKAHKKRTYLAMLTYEKVIPFWQKKWPQDKFPINTLTEINEILKGKLNIEKLKEEYRLQNLRGVLDDKSNNNDYSEIFVIAVGYCGVKAMQTALFDEDYDEKNIDVLEIEPFDCYDHDAAYIAELVYTKDHTDIAASKEFWEWYLNTAVIEAWNYLEN